MKPYYDHNGITIYHGDCLEILPELEPVDLVLTDPPYGCGKAEWDDEFPSWSIIEFFKISQAICVMPGLWHIGDCINAMHKRYRWIIAGFNLNGMTFGKIGFNNWIPAVCGGEGIKHGGKDAFLFSIGREPKFDHPSQKPLPFIKFLVSRLTEEGNTLIDPFLGSGTTLVAAKELGRRAIGIEIEEKYCEIAARRLAQEMLPFGSNQSLETDGQKDGHRSA
jgi:site-specific DNA-methyltransferase (adenine-specific)